MMGMAIKKLANLPGAALCSREDLATLNARLAGRSFSLPAEHVELRAAANGIAVYRGYFRLFGVGCTRCIDLIRWNEFDTWKFSWSRDLSRFLCFGETAWGDQYAYDLDGRDSKVYFLEALNMKAEVIAESFDEFLVKEFTRCASAPYDKILIEGSQAIGELKWAEHITYMPSLLLGGTENPKNVIKINTRASMIANGDLATECAKIGGGRAVKSLENYVDTKERPRIRVRWR